jgi:hypothetical protein
MAIDLIPLATLKVQLKPPITIEGGPTGTRMIFEVVSADVEGERLRGQLKGAAAADWLLIGPHGTAMLDVRVTLETDDGADIYLHYHGRSDVSAGIRFPLTIYVAPLFETGDPRYAWLNRVQAVGKGVVTEDLALTYEWYELR